LSNSAQLAQLAQLAIFLFTCALVVRLRHFMSTHIGQGAWHHIGDKLNTSNKFIIIITIITQTILLLIIINYYYYDLPAARLGYL